VGWDRGCAHTSKRPLRPNSRSLLACRLTYPVSQLRADNKRLTNCNAPIARDYSNKGLAKNAPIKCLYSLETSPLEYSNKGPWLSLNLKNCLFRLLLEQRPNRGLLTVDWVTHFLLT
jgi:hypothetical protein